MLCNEGIIPLMKTGTLKSVYIANFHYAVLYGITAWGNSTDHDKISERKSLE